MAENNVNSFEFRRRQAMARARAAQSQQPPQDTFGRDITRAAAQGLTFGFADEMEAFARSLFDDETYEEKRDEIRGQIKKFAEERPALALGAEIAGSLPTALLGGAGLARAGITGAGKIAAIEGATYGLGAGEGGVAEQATSAAVGGLVGGGIGKVADVALPKATEAAKALLKEGLPLTPGQTVGGMTRRAEERLTSVPIVGDAIRAAENRVVNSFNRATMNKAIAPIGQSVPKKLEGQEAFAFAKNQVDEAYEEIIPKLSIQNTAPLDNAVEKIKLANNDLPAELAETLSKKIDKQLLSRIKDDQIAGQALKDAESGLGEEAINLSRSGDAFQRQIGRALFDTQTALRKTLAEQNPNAEQLKKVNQAFAQLVPVQEAALAATVQQGRFTPAQLLRGIKKSDKSRRKTKVAKGEAPLQQFGQEAQEVIARTVPDSGTPERALMAMLLSNPLAAVAYGLPAATVAGSIYGNPLGRAAGRQLVQAPNRLVRGVAPATGGIVGGLLEEEIYGPRGR